MNASSPHVERATCIPRWTAFLRRLSGLTALCIGVAAHATDPAVPPEQLRLPKNWDSQLDSTNSIAKGNANGCNSDRFTCVLMNYSGTDLVAVRDNETGLVWARDPDDSVYTWEAARFRCVNRAYGDRRGWRLPGVHELGSLVYFRYGTSDTQVPHLHPFRGVQATRYWSATTSASEPTRAWTVDFSNTMLSEFNKTMRFPVWCVRGSMNEAQY